MAATARPATRALAVPGNSPPDPRRPMRKGAVTDPGQTPYHYQVRIGHRTFQGSDIRSLLKLAVAARRNSDQCA